MNAYSYGTAITENTVPVWHIGALAIEKVAIRGLYFRFLRRQLYWRLSKRNYIGEFLNIWTIFLRRHYLYL